MIQGISSTFASLPVASIACTTTGFYFARNFCAAAIYKIGSMGAKIFASTNASEWDQTSHEFFTIAKKNGARDLTAAASLITIGLASGYAQEKISQKEEPSYFQSYGLPVVAGSALLAIGMKLGWALKRTQTLEAIKLSEFSPLLKNSKLREERFKELKNIIRL